MDHKFEIVLYQKIPKNCVMITGFQGVGLVGTLAAQYMADKTKAKLIGHVNSTALPPMAIIVEGEIKHPIRIYLFKSKATNFLIFESEIPISNQLVHPLAASLIEFAYKNDIKEIVSLEGMATQDLSREPSIYGVTNQIKIESKISKYMNILKNGIIVGLSAALLIEAKVRDINALCFISEAHVNFPDGIAASNLIDKLNEVYHLKIDTSELRRESHKFEQQMKSIISKVKELKEENVPSKHYIG